MKISKGFISVPILIGIAVLLFAGGILAYNSFSTPPVKEMTVSVKESLPKELPSESIATKKKETQEVQSEPSYQVKHLEGGFILEDEGLSIGLTKVERKKYIHKEYTDLYFISRKINFKKTNEFPVEIIITDEDEYTYFLDEIWLFPPSDFPIGFTLVKKISVEMPRSAQISKIEIVNPSGVSMLKIDFSNHKLCKIFESDFISSLKKENCISTKQEIKYEDYLNWSIKEFKEKNYFDVVKVTMPLNAEIREKQKKCKVWIISFEVKNSDYKSQEIDLDISFQLPAGEIVWPYNNERIKAYSKVTKTTTTEAGIKREISPQGKEIIEYHLTLGGWIKGEEGTEFYTLKEIEKPILMILRENKNIHFLKITPELFE